MKTIHYITPESEALIVNFLTEMFPKQENELVYSLGYQRYSKLSAAKKKSCFAALYLEGFENGLANHEELKRRLAEMTEQEFLTFKTSK